MSLRVCIADDHWLMLDAVRRALESSEGIDIVGMTQSGGEVGQMVREQEPDLVLLDLHMGDHNGVMLLKEIKAEHPQIKVVMLSATEDVTQIGEALKCGADAYVSKRVDPLDLPSTLRQVMAGIVYHQSPLGVSGDDPDKTPSDLTERELTMLEAICRGLSTKAMSRELCISEKTIKFHLTNVYRKLGVHNRTGAMRYAFDHGLVANGAEPGPTSLSA